MGLLNMSLDAGLAFGNDGYRQCHELFMLPGKSSVFERLLFQFGGRPVSAAVFQVPGAKLFSVDYILVDLVPDEFFHAIPS